MDHPDTPQWQGMDDATRADAYSPSKALPDGDLMPFIQRYIDKSAAAYATLDVTTIRYGDKPANTVDVAMPSDTPAPLHIFLHGGYWQELSKRESLFPAPDALSRGMGFAAVDYTLAPEATLDQIVDECCAAIETLVTHAATLGFDPKRIVLSGSSAGAQLAAMCCLKLPPHCMPQGVVLLSGVYDLEPLIGTYVNDALGLDKKTARRNSPAHADLSQFPRTLIAWGQIETDEFKRQSRAFAKALPNAQAIEIPNRNHFDIVEDLCGDTDLGRALASLLD